MLTTRSPTYWTVPIVFLALTAGCFPPKPLQVTIISSVPSASAQAPPNNQMVTRQANCKNSQTQAEINSCASLSAKAADKQLNQFYQQLRAKIKGSQQEKLLINAQIAWIKFRDASCEFERSRFAGGTITPSIYFSCIEQVTKQRSQDLEDYLRPR